MQWHGFHHRAIKNNLSPACFLCLSNIRAQHWPRETSIYDMSWLPYFHVLSRLSHNPVFSHETARRRRAVHAQAQ